MVSSFEWSRIFLVFIFGGELTNENVKWKAFWISRKKNNNEKISIRHYSIYKNVRNIWSGMRWTTQLCRNIFCFLFGFALFDMNLLLFIKKIGCKLDWDIGNDAISAWALLLHEQSASCWTRWQWTGQYLRDGWTVQKLIFSVFFWWGGLATVYYFRFFFFWFYFNFFVA